jgi:tetratricopeptide (TPR) repeat protein
MLDWAAGGRPENLHAFHRTSLLLHAANTTIAFLLLYRLLGALWPSALAALLFGLHPLAVEPLAWVGERKTLLAAFFALVSLLLYVAYARRQNLSRYAASILAFFLALLSKPTAMPIPLVMLILDIWPLRRLNRRAITEKMPFFVLAAVAALITIISQGRTARILTSPAARPLADHVLLFCHNLAFYVSKMLWPAQVCGNYTAPVPLVLREPAVLRGVLVTIVLAIAVAVSARYTRAVYAGALVFVTAILPTMGIVGFTTVVAADKFVYLPAIGVLLLLAWAIQSLRGALAGRRGLLLRAACFVAVAVAAGAEATVSRRHHVVWRDSVTLYQHMIRVSPRSLTAHYNLGLVLAKKGEHLEAIEHFAAAAAIDPGFAPAQREWGLALERLGRPDEAIEHYEAAVRLDPASFNAHFDLARLRLARGDAEEAARHYATAARLRPSHADAHYGLGAALLAQGRLREGEAALRQALRLDPQHALARQALEALENMPQSYPAP